MSRGAPAISDVRDLSLRPLAQVVSNIRQRIEALETSLTALESSSNSATALAALQARVQSLTAVAGTVTRVDATVPSFLSVSGVPITGLGTIAISLVAQTRNLVFSGPASGSVATPTFRALVHDDTPAVDWLDVFSDYTLAEDDAGNGIAATGNSGAQNIVVPGEDVPFPIGKSVLLVQEGAARVDIVAVSGVQLLYLVGRLPRLIGAGAVVWLTKRAADSWLLYGDLAT